MPENTNALTAQIAVLLIASLHAAAQSVPKESAWHGVVNEVFGPEARASIVQSLTSQGVPRASDLFAEIDSRVGDARAHIANKTIGPLSAASYDRVRAEWMASTGLQVRAGKRVWPPTSQTVRAHLGAQYWNDAMQRTGLPVSQGRARGNLRFEEADYSAALQAFLEDHPSGAFADYAGWAKEQVAAGTTRPSGAAIRRQFGSWNAAKDAAQGSATSL